MLPRNPGPYIGRAQVAPSILYVITDDEGHVRGTTNFILVAKNALSEAANNGIDISEWVINEYHFTKEVR